MRVLCRVVLALTAGMAAGVVLMPQALAQVRQQVVARTGQAAPGMPEGVLFQSFLECQLNNAGEVAFVAQLTDAEGQPAGADQQAVFLADANTVQLVAASGLPAPGVSDGSTFGILKNLVLNERGDIGFLGVLHGPAIQFGVNQIGIWVGRPGSLKLAARSGQIAAGTSDLPLRLGLNRFALSATGRLALLATVGEGGTGIWTGPPGALELGVRTQRPAPATTWNIQSLAWPEQPSINGLGQLTFAAMLDNGSTVTPAVVYAGPPGRLDFLAWPGEAAPLPETAWGDVIGTPSINNAGQILVDTWVYDAVGAQSFESLWLFADGSTQAIASEGDAAPGTGLFFADFDGGAALNGAGTVAFVSHLRKADGSAAAGIALHLAKGNQLQLIMHDGAQAPGFPEGVTFGDPSGGGTLLAGPYVNGRGQVAFAHAVSGPDARPGENAGVWATDYPQGRLTLLLRPGDAMQFDGTPDRIVRSINAAGTPSSGREDGRGSPFNDSGQYCIIAKWVELSGSVPVTGAAVLLLELPAPLRLSGPDWAGAGWEISFQSAAGRQYQLQATTDLIGGKWETAVNVEGTAQTTRIALPATRVGRSVFFRVLELP